MKNCLFFFLGFLLLLNLNARANETDSLLNVVNTPSFNDTIRVNAAIDVSKIYLAADNDSLFITIKKAWLILAQLPLDRYKIKSEANLFYVLGSYYSNQNQQTEGLKYLHYSLALFEKLQHKIGMAALLNNIGVIYNDKSDYIKAIDYYLRALKIKEQLGKKIPIAYSYINIARIYYAIGDLDKSLEYDFKAIEIFKTEKDDMAQAVLYSNIALIYSDKNEFEKAIAFEQKCIRFSLLANDSVTLGRAYSNLGSVYAEMKKPKLALENATKGLNILTKLQDKTGLANATLVLAEFYYVQNDFKKTIQFAQEALILAKETEEITNIRDANKLLYLSLKEENNLPEAFKHLEIYTTLLDSLLKSDSQKQIVKQEINYQFEKKEANNRLLQEKKEIEIKAKSRLQRIISYSILAILVLVLIFSLSLYKRFIITRKQNVIIDEQKRLVEDKQKEVISSITYAKRIQYALLASDSFLKKGLSHAAWAAEHFLIFKPKDIVSGDFYWAAKNETSFYLAVCDCTGHGVPGAFMSLLNSNYLREAVTEKGIKEPNLIFDYVRKRLEQGFENNNQKDGMDAILLRFDLLTGKITYAAANNRSLLISNNKVVKLQSDKMPVGKGEIHKDFSLYELELSKGDSLYLFTDGFADQFGGSAGKKFMYKQLSDLLQSNSSQELSVQYTNISEAFESWKGNLEQVDDVTLLGIRF